jgi:hypothetical protein
MFLFMSFDIYVVKVLRGHLKDKCRHFKHHTIFYVQQQALGNTCGFHICLNMVVFEAQSNYEVSAFILLYCWCLWLNMHINLLLIYTSHFIVWQDYQSIFINAAGSSLEHIRESYRCSSYQKSSVQKENFISNYRLWVRWLLFFV